MKAEWTAIIIIFLLLSSFDVAVYSVLYDRPEPHTASWAPPEIPQCDKSTWKRITEGCDQ